MAGTDDTTSSFLPLEIEREIFETASLQSLANLSVLAKFMLVAFRVRQWVEPFMYRTAMCSPDIASNYPPIRGPGEAGGCSNAMSNAIQSYRYEVRRHVRNLYCQVTKTYQDDPLTLLDTCLNVRDLFIWSKTTDILYDLEAILLYRPIERLTADLEHGFTSLTRDRRPLNPSVFPYLTHLRAVFISHPGWDWWKNIALLPKLTHFSVDWCDEGLTNSALTNMPHLEVMVVEITLHDEDVHPLLLMTDKRLLLVRISPDESLIGEWQRDTLGEVGFWGSVENIRLERISIQEQYNRIMAVVT